jgi:hypothetical protein
LEKKIYFYSGSESSKLHRVAVTLSTSLAFNSTGTLLLFHRPWRVAG